MTSQADPDPGRDTPPGFEVSVATHARTVTVTAVGEVDIATAPRLRAALDRDKAPDRHTAVVLDLSGVTFIDSSGLHTILEATEHFAGRLSIIASDVCLRLFDLAGMSDRLPLRP